MSSRVKGVFAHLDCFITGIDRLKKAGFSDMEVASPLPRHEIEEVLYEGRPSPVRWWTLVGGITGGSLGFTLAALTGVDWPMAVVGGKPIVSVPPYIIITFECTVLLGALATLLALMFHCRLPFSAVPEELQDDRFSNDMFGVVVQSSRGSEVAEILKGAGAVEVLGDTGGPDV
jgi:molybdopterin-containing oxidoreductase family membrane subunit